MSDQVALVTGGSRGIGRAIALELSQRCRVAVNYHADDVAAKATVNEIEDRGGVAYAFRADVAETDEVGSMFEAVERAFGPVNVLVNNAGIRRDGLGIAMRPEQFHAVVATVLLGTFNTTSRALRSMLQQRSGCIVNIASVAGLRASPGQVNYAAAKAGVIALTKTFAAEVGRKGIRVNAVAPGLVSTDMTADLPQAQRSALIDATPARRAGTPEEVAAAVAFLSSPQASYINGSVMTIDGGLTA